MKDHINDMRAYFRSGHSVEYQRGHTQRLTDDATSEVFYLAKGYIRLYACNSPDEQYTHVIYGPGDIYPISWLAANPFKGLYAEALTDCTVYTLPTSQLCDDIAKRHDLTSGLLQQTVLQFRYYAGRVTNLEYKYASERLGYRLLSLANRFGEQTEYGITIIPPLTHHVLGTSINLTRESVSREMEKLSRRGFVTYNADRQIVVTDAAGLSRYLQIPVSARN